MKGERMGTTASSGRKAAKMLACVLALAMVACAVVAVIPDENNNVDGANAVIPASDAFTEGMTLVEGKTYVLQAGDHRAILENLATESGATIILMDGASITLEGRGYADIVKITAATNINTYDAEKAVTITGVTDKTFEITVGMTANVTTGSYQNVMMDLTVGAAIAGTDYEIGVAKGTPIVAAGDIWSTAQIENLQYAYYEVSNGAYIYYAESQGTVEIALEAGKSWGILSADAQFTLAGENGFAFTVTPADARTTPLTVSYAATGVTVTGNAAGEVELVSGTVVGSQISYMDAAVVTKTGSVYTYSNEVQAQYVLAGEGNSVEIAAGSKTVVVDNAEAATMSIELAPVGGYAAIAYNGGYRVYGDFESGVTLQTGTVKSTPADDLTDRMVYGYAVYTTKFDYYADGISEPVVLTANQYILVKEVATTYDGTAIRGVIFSTDFQTTDGFKIMRDSNGSQIVISGSVDAGSIKVVNLSIAAETELVIGENASLLVSESNTFTVNGKLVNNGTVAGAEGATATLKVVGAYEGNVPVIDEKLKLSVDDLNVMAGADWNYTTYNSTDGYVLYKTAEAATIAIDGTEISSVTVRSAAAAITVTGETSPNNYTVSIPAGYATGAEEKLLVVDGTTGLGGTVAAGQTVTVSNGTVGTLTVNGILDVTGGTVNGATVVGTMNVSGTATFQDVTVEKDGVVDIAAGATVSSVKLTNNGIIDLDGTLNVINREQLTSVGTVNLVSTSVVSQNGNVLLGTNAVELSEGSTAVVSAIAATHGFTLEVKAGTATVKGGYLTAGSDTDITVAEGAEVVIATAFTNTGTIVNNGKVTVLKDATLTNSGTGKMTNNKDVVVAGAISGSFANEGTVSVTAVSPMDAITGATLTGTNQAFTGEGWTYGTVESVKTLTITGNVTGQQFVFTEAITVVAAGDYNVEYTGTVFKSESATITFSGDYELTVTGDVDGTAYAIAASVDIKADMYVIGGITGAAIRISSDLAVEGIAAGAIVYTTSLTVDGANLNLSMPESATEPAITINGGYKDSGENVAASTIIADGVTIVKADAVADYKNTLIAVNGGYVTYTVPENDSSYLVVDSGLAVNAQKGYIYMYNGATRNGSNILTNPIEDAFKVAEGSAVYNIFADAVADTTSANVVFLAVAPVDLDGQTILRTMTITQDVSGSVIVDKGVELTVNNYTVADGETAEINGVLVVKGTLTGTVKLGENGSVTAFVYGVAAEEPVDGSEGDVATTTDTPAEEEAEPADTPATINGMQLVGVNGVSIAAAVGGLTVSMTEGTTVVNGEFAFAGMTVAFAQGTSLAATINGMPLTLVAGAGFGISMPAAQTEDPTVDPEEPSVDPDAPSGEDTPVQPDEPAGEDTPTEEPAVGGSETTEAVAYILAAEAPADNTGMVISGDFELNTSISGAELAIINGNITTTNPDGVTITVDDLVIGDVVFGTGITIVVEGTLTAVGEVTGPEGFIKLNAGGSIVDDGEYIDPSCVDAGSASTTVTDVDGLIAALPYFSEIIVDVGEEAAAEAYQFLLTTDLTVCGKTINFVAHGDNIYTLTVAEGATLTVGGTDDEVRSVIQGDVEIDVDGKLVLSYADIYANVYVDDANLDVQNKKTMEIGGNSQISEDIVIGFGNDLVITSSGFKLDALMIKVWGTMTVNGNLSVSSAATANGVTGITIYDSGSMTIPAEITLALNGEMYVYGEAVINGTMDVGETGYLMSEGDFQVVGSMTVKGTLEGMIYDEGTVVFDGTSNNAVIIISQASAPLNVLNVGGTLTVGIMDVDLEVLDAIVFTDLAPADNSVGVTVAYSVTDGKGVMDVSGTIEAAPEGSVVMTSFGNGGFAVTGALTVVSGTVEFVGTSVEIAGTLDIAGGTLAILGSEFDVSGTVTVSADAEIGASDYKLDEVTYGTVIDILGGSIAVSSTVNEYIAVNGDVTINATYYDTAVAATEEAAGYVIRTYTTFDAAVATEGVTQVTVIGAQTAMTEATVSADIVIADGAKLTVDTVLTIAGAMDNQSTAADKNIVVEGTLVINDYTKYTEAGETVVPLIKAEVVVPGENNMRTFTSLANAQEMGLTDVVLNDDVEIAAGETVVIEAGVTVSSDTYDIVVGNGGALIVEGAVEFTGDSDVIIVPVVEGAVPGTVTVVEADEADAAENGYIAVENTEGSLNGVTGAHYTKLVPAAEEGAEPTRMTVVGTMMHAAADSASIVADVEGATPTVTVVGDVATANPEFAVNAAGLDITVPQSASLKADSITLAAGNSIIATGELSADIAYGTNTVQVEGAGASVTPVDEEGVQFIGVTGDIVGSVIAVEGLVAVADLEVSGEGAGLTVNEGAAMAVGDADVYGAVYVAGEMTVNGVLDADTVTVTGTMEVSEGATVFINNNADLEGAVLLNGDMTIGEAEIADMAVGATGTLYVTENLVFGEKPTTIAAGAAVAADGAVITVADGGEIVFSSGVYIKAYGDNTVAGLTGTTYTVSYGDASLVYMTAYGDATVMDVLYDETFDLTYGDSTPLYTGLYYGPDNSSNTGLYSADNWYKTEAMLANSKVTGVEDLGAEGATAVYAAVESLPVSVTVSVEYGAVLYIDGMPYGSSASGTYDLAYGEYTVTVSAMAGFTVEDAVITFNGETVTGGTIVIGEGTPAGAKLTVTGVAQAGTEIVVPTPEPTPSTDSGDDGLTLTEILLVVLVVLIVVMAIIVALRLMRS